MRFYTSLFIAVTCCLFVDQRVSAQGTRTETLFDANWKFYKGDVPGAESNNFDDKSWRVVDLPHDWTIEPLPNQKPGEVMVRLVSKAPALPLRGIP